jgi:hypothetical protein
MSAPDGRWRDLTHSNARPRARGVTETLADRAAAQRGRHDTPGGVPLSIGKPQGVVDRAEARRRAADSRDDKRGPVGPVRQTASGYFLAALLNFIAGVLMLLDPIASAIGWVFRRPRRLVPHR